MLSVNKAASLVQQKKQQWAREREEMSQLYMPWGSGKHYLNRLPIRNQFASSLELHKEPYDYQKPMQRQRSPSLPPIHHSEPDRNRTKEVLNRNIPTAKRFAFYDEDGEGDTSGYGSETVNHRSNAIHDGGNRNPVMAWQQNDKDNRSLPCARQTLDDRWSARSPRSTSEEGRLRWGDRGVATGRLWEPTAAHARLPQMPNRTKGTPSWVERGLNMIENSAEVLVVDQRNSPNSGFECDRSSYNGSEEGKTYLRGQNVPIEPEVRAQRENKRIKALELQSAILSQLEDREKRRQEERQRQQKEERLEELRLKRQQEADKAKLEEEKRRNEEKQLLEKRKLESLKRALEEAEKKAKMEKEKRYHSLKQNLTLPLEHKNKEEDKADREMSFDREIDVVSPTKSNRTYDVRSAKSVKKEHNSQQTTEFNSPRSTTGPGNLNLFIHSMAPLSLGENQFNIIPIGINGNGDLVTTQSNALQLAVLVPQSINNSLYSVSLNSLNNLTDSCETGKVLTPRKYRSSRTKDAATQTECTSNRYTSDKVIETDVERNNEKEYSYIDENAPQENHHSLTKKDRRFRSEEKYKKDLENRPKWGVNRPAAQYKKQSEKDPFYSQKRKIRQKYRAQARQYLSQSSDDSRSPSPSTRSEKVTENGNQTRNSLSQSHWRNKRSSQDLPRNTTTTTTTVCETATNIALDFNHIGPAPLSVNEITDNEVSPKISPFQRMTLSQKFINDKYGNRKLWVDVGDVNDKHGRQNNIFEGENRKQLIDQINLAKRDFYDRTENQVNVKPK